MSEVAQRHQRARIQQIAQSRGLTCKCGSTRWRFQRVKPQITGAVARLDCERCGRSSKLHLSRHEANRWECRVLRRLEGTSLACTE